MSDATEEFLKGIEQFMQEDHTPLEHTYYLVFDVDSGDITRTMMAANGEGIEADQDHGAVAVSKELYETPGLIATHMITKDLKVMKKPDGRAHKFLEKNDTGEFMAMQDNMLFTVNEDGVKYGSGSN